MAELRSIPTPSTTAVGNNISAYPLPKPPFKHDQPEMKKILLHANALFNKYLIVSKHSWPPSDCTNLINATRVIRLYNVRSCTTTLKLISKHTSQSQPFIDLHDFTLTYQKAEAAKKPKKVVLPVPHQAKYTVSELNVFREYIKAVDPQDLENYPGTSTHGLNDDLSNPENKKLFTQVLQELRKCSKSPIKKDRQNDRLLSKRLQSYYRGFKIYSL